MNVLNRIGGTILLGILIVLLVNGAKSQTGAAIVDPMWAGIKSGASFLKTSIPSIGATKGKGVVSLAVGALITLGLLAGFQSLRFGKGFAFAVAVGAVGALLLFNPTAFA